jgi:hypothetical protein
MCVKILVYPLPFNKLTETAIKEEIKGEKHG